MWLINHHARPTCLGISNIWWGMQRANRVTNGIISVSLIHVVHLHLIVSILELLLLWWPIHLFLIIALVVLITSKAWYLVLILCGLELLNDCYVLSLTLWLRLDWATDGIIMTNLNGICILKIILNILWHIVLSLLVLLLESIIATHGVLDHLIILYTTISILLLNALNLSKLCLG